MDWGPEVEELRRRESLAREMGGTAKVARQHAAGRLTVRERIDALLDPGSFHEIGAITGSARYDETGVLQALTPANFVFGRGLVEGRRITVAGDDFTVRGGASDASIIEKQVAAERMAQELRLPLVRLVEGSGGGGSVKSLESLGYTYVPYLPGWDLMTANLATVPVVSLGLGPVAGFGAAKVVASHYSLLVRGQAQMFVAGGLWTAASSAKLERFVSFAETFHLPVVHLVDNPGFNIGRQAGLEGTIRAGARALAAIYQATVPWCSVIVRKVFGVAGAGHMNHTRYHYRFAWPSADWGSLPIEGGIEAAYKSELEGATDRDARIEEIRTRLNLLRSPFRSAEHFQVEEIVDPRDTRRLLCEFAQIAAPLRRAGPSAFSYRP